MEEEIKRFSIRLKPKTVAWFDSLIGQLRRCGITMSMNEFVAYMAWELQQYVPKDITVPNEKMTEKEIEDLKKKVLQFRYEMEEEEVK